MISALFLASALSVGAGQYGFGLFIGPLEDTFGWNRSQISASLSLTAVGSLIAPFIGRIMDRHGARYIMAGSMGLIAISYLLRPLMTELWHWYALSLIQYLGYTGGTILPAGRLVGIWFQRTRGRVMGFTAMGANFGGLTMPPLLGLILPVLMWEGSYLVLSALSGVMMLYTLAFVNENPPASEDDDDTEESSSQNASVILTGWTLKEALRSKAFYAITLTIMMGTFTYAAILPQIITHLTDQGVSVKTASVALSVFAIFGMTGKLFMGLLAERITARYTLMINFIGQATFLILLMWAGSPVIMWIAIPLYGYFNGAFGALFQLVVQNTFGIRHFGSIMGVINLTTIVSFGIGPIMAGASFDLTGSYRVVFIIVSVMFLIGAVSLTQAGVSERQPATGEDSD
ncbi:MAG: MFS transporter [SAR202 cluster bacterium]|nr:MFS transporter [SAR202 cluster bacterium]MDP6513902.1 MFS transporter [SAR202 cluster bacterium]